MPVAGQRVEQGFAANTARPHDGQFTAEGNLLLDDGFAGQLCRRHGREITPFAHNPGATTVIAAGAGFHHHTAKLRDSRLQILCLVQGDPGRGGDAQLVEHGFLGEAIRDHLQGTAGNAAVASGQIRRQALFRERFALHGNHRVTLLAFFPADRYRQIRGAWQQQRSLRIVTVHHQPQPGCGLRHHQAKLATTKNEYAIHSRSVSHKQGRIEGRA